MSDHPPIAATHPLPNWAKPLVPVSRRPGKREQQVWMKCFWMAFIWFLILSLGTVVEFASPNSYQIPFGSLPLRIMLFWLWNSWASGCDILIAALASLVAMYVFGRARAGLSYRRPLILWLSVRLTILCITAISVIVIGLNYSYSVWWWRSVLGRMFFFDLPILVWLAGEVAVSWLRRLPEPELTIDPPSPPIDPLA
jgi:hypothetical protein